MKNNNQGRKTRQLARLVEELKVKMADKNSSLGTIHQLKLRIKFLLKELIGFIETHHLKRILGALAVVFGFTATSKAQVFSAPVQNPFGLTQPAVQSYLSFPEFADLDNDGDLDILCGGYNANFQYYQNTGSATAPVFAAPVADPFGLSDIQYLAAPALGDLDNDGDLDLLVGEYYGNLNYYENIGTSAAPNFAAPISVPFGLTNTYNFAFPSFVDLDNDGDLDLLVGDANSDQQYFENTGTASLPAFAAPVSNPFGLQTSYGIAIPELADLDHDGDFDLVIGAYAGAFQYVENIGTVNNPAFSNPLANPFGLTPTYYFNFPAIADLDNDGDVDILVAEYYGVFQYFQNIDPTTSLDEISLQGSISPNPMGDFTNFDFDNQIQTAEFINLSGQVVLTVNKPGKNVDVSSLESGIYLVKCTNAEQQSAIVKLQKL